MEILIADDDPVSRNMLKEMVIKMGHTVVETENGKQALEILKNGKIQFVITDWLMPVMNGLDLCNRLRSTFLGRYIYIIMITAKDEKKDLMAVFNTGADDYIPKPLDPDEMMARVQTGCRVIELEQRHESMQNTLIESRNKLRVVFDALREEIVALDQNYRIISINKAFADQAGCKIDAIVGKNYFEISAPLDAGQIRQSIEKAFKEATVQQILLEGKDLQDRPIYKQVICLPIKDECKQVFQTVVVCADITESRRKSEKIQALNKRLLEFSKQLENKNQSLEKALADLEKTQAHMLQSEKLASIGQLAAGVAHEINNPTGYVSSNLKTLDDYQQNMGDLIKQYRKFISILENDQQVKASSAAITEGIEHLKKMEKKIDIDFLLEDVTDLIADCRDGTNRIKMIVQNLKDFAHPGEDKIQSTDVNKALETTLSIAHNELKYKATVHTDFGNIPYVLGNPQQLNQVFVNIIVNAAQAIDKKGDIFIKTWSEDSSVHIEISDTGCGIPKKNLSKIFDPFFTTKDVGKGTGLGMNIAYNIIQKHNGTIEVSSEVGKGTSFTITLPAEIVDSDDMA
jgi:two-component system NtrC family sensor kinase